MSRTNFNNFLNFLCCINSPVNFIEKPQFKMRLSLERKRKISHFKPFLVCKNLWATLWKKCGPSYIIDLLNFSFLGLIQFLSFQILRKIILLWVFWAECSYSCRAAVPASPGLRYMLWRAHSWSTNLEQGENPRIWNSTGKFRKSPRKRG